MNKEIQEEWDKYPQGAHGVPKLISTEDKALWARGASNAGYHYLGCAKTFALMGKGFAEANLAMMEQKKRP